LHETAKAMKEKKIRYNKRSEAYQAFTSVYNELSESFRLHKSIANVVFRTDKKSLVKLTGMNFASKNYEKSMEQISTFYTLGRSNTEVQSKLARLRLTSEKLDLVKDNSFGRSSQSELHKRKSKIQGCNKNKKHSTRKNDLLDARILCSCKDSH
jgi:hypothetical protein